MSISKVAQDIDDPFNVCILKDEPFQPREIPKTKIQELVYKMKKPMEPIINNIKKPAEPSLLKDVAKNSIVKDREEIKKKVIKKIKKRKKKKIYKFKQNHIYNVMTDINTLLN